MTTTTAEPAWTYTGTPDDGENPMAGIPGTNLAEQNKNLAEMLAQARQSETLVSKISTLVRNLLRRAQR